MELILVVVLFILFFYHGSRIKRLEDVVNKSDLKTAPVLPQKTAVQSSSSLQSAAPVVSTEPAPVPVPNVQPKIPSASGEETSGKILGRLGIGAVILGVASFLKYAFDNNWVGPSGRVVIGILCGLLILAIAQMMRRKYSSFSDLLMGGGLAVLYLSIYASYGFYHLVDPMLAFMGMIVVTAVGVILSIMNATIVLSSIAFIGGFLTPYLIGLGNMSPMIMFSYITILNLGVLAISLFKKWANLNLVGVFGTVLLSLGFFSKIYEVNILTETMMFLSLQFIIYTISSVWRIIIDKIKAKEVDYFTITLTTFFYYLISFLLLYTSYKNQLFAIFVVAAVMYFAIAYISFKRNPEDNTINKFLPALSVISFTIAIPILASGSWLVFWWMLESLLMFLVASKISSRGFQVMGVAVYILSLTQLLWYGVSYSKGSDYVVFFNTQFLLMMAEALVAYIIAFMYYKFGSTSVEIRKNGINAFVVIANVITLSALTLQIVNYYEIQANLGINSYSSTRNMSNTTVSILWALYAILLTVIGFARKYVVVRRLGLILFIITAFKVFVDVTSLGPIYRIISFIVFGIIALLGSFLYVKYKDRLKEVV